MAKINLAEHWPKIECVARKRLRSNKTDHHVDKYGDELEIKGVAGEVAARLYLGLGIWLHTGFDGGVDMIHRGWKINAKAAPIEWKENGHLHLPLIACQFDYKLIKNHIFFLIGIDVKNKAAEPVGWCYREEIINAPINHTKPYPCHEIPNKDLRLPVHLKLIEPNEKHIPAIPKTQTA